jgi:hypothetical protein
MNDFSRRWNLEMALEVVQNASIDEDTWSEAVAWLLLHGPPELKEVLCQASGHATCNCFPDLQPAGFNTDGEVCYDIDSLAQALGLPEEEIVVKLKEIEETQGAQQLYELSEAKKIQ